MELIPVLDLRGGVVIRGQAGQRGNYLPNTSQLVSSAEPVATCRALLRSFSPQSIYVADLDGIEHARPQLDLIEHLARCPVDLAVDAGTSTLEQADDLLHRGVKKVIIGLETLPHLEEMRAFVKTFGAERVLFSLDLMDGDCIGPDARGKNPFEVVAQAIDAGVRQMIVLDLSQVGMNRGVSTVSLCHSIKNRWSELVVWTGGGIRALADLHKLSLSRVDGAMVASALHDGRLTPSDWKSFQALSDDLTQMAMDA